MAEASTVVTTGKVRLSYCYLYEPRKDDDGNPDKYGCTILIPKTDKATVAKLKGAIEAAKAIGKGKSWGGKIPPNLKVTLHDGDTEKDTDESPEYIGHYYMSVSSKDKPGLVDAQVNPAAPGEIYSGCFARVNITAAPYSNSGNKGITFYLNHVQFIADGERLDNRSKPEDVFSALDAADAEESEGSLI